MRALRLIVVLLLAAVTGGLAVFGGGGGANGAAAVPSCSGEAIARAGGGYMTCSFDDEFNGTSVDATKWYAVQGTDFHSGKECFVPSPSTIGVGGGALRLSIVHLTTGIRCGNRSTTYASGMLSTGGRFAQAFGRFEIRAKLPTGPALQSALWMYPVKTLGPWPTSGEIDIAELFGLYPTYALPHLHYLAPSGRKAPGTYCSMANAATTFHTYAVDWTPSAIRFLYDGKLCFSTSGWIPHRPQVAPAPFNAPFDINLTLAMSKTQKVGAVAHTAWPSSIYVDYVRVWK
jgi:beta-glucanase (GH16 family)